MKKFLALFLSVILLLSLVACSDSPADQPDEEGNEQSSEQVIYDGDSVKATFMNAYDEPSIDGVFYLQILFENKTNSRIWVYLDDASVNGYSTTVMSALPMEIDPGNKSKQPFVIPYANLDTDNIDGVKDISFKICAEDTEDHNSILKTDSLTITLK